MARQCHNCDSRMEYDRKTRIYNCECGATFKSERDAEGRRTVRVAAYPETGSQNDVTKAEGEKTAFAVEGSILRKSGEDPETKLHYVLNVVLSPGTPDATLDTQGDYYTKQDIWEAQRSFQKSRQMGLCHMGPAKGVSILHDSVAFTDFEFGGQVVKDGSWYLGVEIDEGNEDGAKLWKQIVDGEINAFSIGGTGRRIPVDGVYAET